MEKQQLQRELHEVHNNFISFLAKLSGATYSRALPGRWSAGQHLDHILKSVTAVNRGITNAKFMQPVEQVISNRAPMDISGLQALYRQKAGGGATAPPQFAPGDAGWREREQLFMNVEAAVNELCQMITDLPDAQLDGLALPHPLLGWLSLREMMYFTIFHGAHHFDLAKKAVLENDVLVTK